MRYIALIIFLLPITRSGISQDTDTGSNLRYPYFQFLYHTGVYWSRTEYLKEQFEEGYRAIEARFGFQSTGKEYWQQLNNYPQYGVGIHYADLVKDRGDTLVGNPFSAFLFYGAPRIRFGRFAFNTNLSLGLSYASLIHDPLTNPFNDVIASHVNLFFDFNVNLSCKLSNRLDLHGGYGVTHYSNGRIHQPQKGVNNWGWNFGMSYHFVPPEHSSARPEFIRSEPPEFHPFNELQFMYAAGAVDHHRLGDLEGVHYFTSSFTIDYAHTFHPRIAVAMGADVLYDGSLEIAIRGTPPDEVTPLQKIYLGSHLGIHFYCMYMCVCVLWQALCG